MSLLNLTARRNARRAQVRPAGPAERTFGPVPREIASLPQDRSRFTGTATVTAGGTASVRLGRPTSAAVGAATQFDRVAAETVAAVLRVAKTGIRRDKDGWPIVVPFDEDEAFCARLNEMVRTVHAYWGQLARVFDERAVALRLRLRLDERRRVAAADEHALTAAYADGGTAAMVGLAEQIRARMVADALNQRLPRRVPGAAKAAVDAGELVSA
jgi:hypothetical protein